MAWLGCTLYHDTDYCRIPHGICITAAHRNSSSITFPQCATSIFSVYTGVSSDVTFRPARIHLIAEDFDQARPAVMPPWSRWGIDSN
jgi:hypothetical protein